MDKQSQIKDGEEAIKSWLKHCGGINSLYFNGLYIISFKILENQQLITAEIILKEIVKNKDADNDIKAKSLHGLAVIYEKTGNYKKSEFYHLSALKEKEKISGTKNESFAISLNSIGYFFLNLRRLNDAGRYFLRSKNILEEIQKNNTVQYANALTGLASVYLRFKKYSLSFKYFKKSIKIINKLDKLDKLDKLNLNTESIINTENKRGIATLFYEINRFVKSEYYYLELIKLFEQSEHKYIESIQYSEILHGLANLYLKMLRFEESEKYFKLSLEIKNYVYGNNSIQYAAVYYDLSELYYLKGNVTQSFKSITVAINSINSINQHLLYSNTNFTFFPFRGYVISFYDRYLNLFFRFANNTDLKEFNYHLLFKRKFGDIHSSNIKRLYFEQTFSKEHVQTRKKFEKDLKEIEAQYEYYRALYKYAGIHSLDRIKKINSQQSLDFLKNQKTLIESQILEFDLNVLKILNKENNYLFRINENDLISKLKTEDVVLEYMKIHDTLNNEDYNMYCGLLFFPKETDKFILKYLGGFLEVEEIINAFRRTISAIGSSIDYSEFKETKRALYRKVLEPFDIYIKEAKNITICTDGELMHIPFEPLLDNKKVRYLNTITDVSWINKNVLLEKKYGVIAYDANYQSSLESIDNAENNTDIDDNIKELKESIFYKKGNNFYSPLIAGDREGEYISELLKNKGLKIEKIQDVNLTKESIIRIKRPLIFHIITHGFFFQNNSDNTNNFKINWFEGLLSSNSDPMERSGFITSGINKAIKENSHSINKHLVTARDIMYMDLLGTKLVVLSSCESALGDIKIGDGVYGLQRAFMLAGAKTLVLSLWKVKDDATSVLMTKFYEYLIEGERVDVSLKKAKEYMRELIMYQDPHYWAGFICIGDGGKVF